MPVANLVFAIPSMPKSQPASPMNVLGLVLIMAGLISYRFWPLIHERLVDMGLLGASKEESTDAEALLAGG